MTIRFSSDGKSEKFELFEDLRKNNIRMHPHLKRLQRINHFQSLLRGEAQQVFRNLDDTKKDNLDVIMIIFMRRLGDYLSAANTRCEWDTLKFDPSTQKLHEFLDSLKTTAKEAFGSEAQQFIDKTIYAKMPDHVQKILNRAYLEDKSYNEIVLHLEREMRLNGLGAPDDVTLVLLNNVTPTTTTTNTRDSKRGFCFYCSRYGHAENSMQKTKKPNGRKQNLKKVKSPIHATLGPMRTCGKQHKTEDCKCRPCTILKLKVFHTETL